MSDIKKFNINSEERDIQGKILSGLGNNENVAISQKSSSELYTKLQTSYSLNRLFLSSTDNQLDIDNVVEGIGINIVNNINIEFINDCDCIVSRFIKIPDNVRYLTISGCKNINRRHQCMVLLKEAKYDTLNNVVEFFYYDNGSGTGTRTIDIYPFKNAKYIVMSLKRYDFDDYSDMKLSFSQNVAIEDFKSVYVGDSLKLNDYNYTYNSKTNNILNTNNYVNNYRLTTNNNDVLIPTVTTNNGAIMSHFMFVKGANYVTWKSNSYDKHYRYYAFFTNKDLDSIIFSFNKPIFKMNTEDVQKITIDVPDEAVYMVVTLATAGVVGDNWKNDTISVGLDSTNDEYKNGDIVEINNEMIYTPFISNPIKDYEKIDLQKRWLPYTVSTNSNVVSFDNYYNTANILFFTDSHIDLVNVNECIDNVNDIIDDIVNKSPIKLDAVIHGGDFVTICSYKENTEVYCKAYFDIIKKSNVPFIQCIGNHDSNDHLLPTYAFYQEDWNNMIFDYFRDKFNIVQNKINGVYTTYHYYDIPVHKIRIISIDINDIDRSEVNSNGNCIRNGANSFYISQEQINWIMNTALDFSEEGWGVIFVSHLGYMANQSIYSTSINPKYESIFPKFISILKAFNTQSTYTHTYTFNDNSFYNLNINADFTKYSNMTNKPHIICWLEGHEHNDFNFKIEGINVICTTNSSCTMACSDSRVQRLPNSPTQNAFDIMNIDTKKRKIRMFRYGAGSNCYGSNGDRFVEDGLDY